MKKAIKVIAIALGVISAGIVISKFIKFDIDVETDEDVFDF